MAADIPMVHSAYFESGDAVDPETILPEMEGFDVWGDDAILEALWSGQLRAIMAVRAALPAIARAAQDITTRLNADGRLIFIGAGSSGEIASLEATELPATFGWPPGRIAHRSAGYRPPPRRIVAEDNADYARGIMLELRPAASDVVVALAASGNTPFTCAAAELAFDAGALVVGFSNRRESRLLRRAHHAIYLASGPEVPAGSTRMNAGTSQKAALNLLSTLVMTRLGRVHDGLMVELRPDRPKFRARATRIIAHLSRCSAEKAERSLLLGGGDIKQAVLIAEGCSAVEAARILGSTDRDLRKALRTLASDSHRKDHSGPA